MAKVEHLQTNFTAGEVSPRMYSRVDFARYANSVKSMRNCHGIVTGGAIRRPGTRHLGGLGTSATNIRLVPFQWQDSGYVLVFVSGTSSVQVFKITPTAATLLTTITVSIADPQSMRISQNGRALYITTGNEFKTITYQNDFAWDVSDFGFYIPPLTEDARPTGSSATLSALTGSITITIAAGNAPFVPADVGRQITTLSSGGLATITAYTSATQVTAQVVAAFPFTNPSDSMMVLDSPFTTLAITGSIEEGGAITLTAGAAAFYSGDVSNNKYIKINGGTVLLTGYTSSTVVTGIVRKKLASSTTAVSGSWQIQRQVFGTSYKPVANGFYGGRFWISGVSATLSTAPVRPNDLFGSKVGDYSNFDVGTNDDDGCFFPIGGDKSDEIRHIASNRSLIVFTAGGEYSLSGDNGGNIKPTGTVIKNESNYGSGTVAPEYVENDIAYVQRSGKKLRSMAYGGVADDAMLSPDVSLLSEHLLSQGVKALAYVPEPEPVMWALMSDGTLRSVCVDKINQVYSWAQHDTDGDVRGICAVNTDGVDYVVLAVYRNFGSGTSTGVMLERMEYGLYQDSVVETNLDTLRTTFNVLPYKDGEIVQVLAQPEINGGYVYVGDFAADASGNITLPTPHADVRVGKQIVVSCELLPPELQLNGTMQGRNARISRVMARVHQTPALTLSGENIQHRNFDVRDEFDTAITAYTGDMESRQLGWSQNGDPVTFGIDIPLPMTVLSIRRTVEVHE